MHFKHSLGWALTNLQHSLLVWVFPRTSWYQLVFLIATASIILVSESEGFHSFFLSPSVHLVLAWILAFAFSVSCILFSSSTGIFLLANVACVSVNVCRNHPLFLKIYTYGKLICMKIIYRHFALQHLWRLSVLGIREKRDCVVIVSIIDVMIADINTFQGINSVLYFYLTMRPVGRGRVDQKIWVSFPALFLDSFHFVITLCIRSLTYQLYHQTQPTEASPSPSLLWPSLFH